MSASIGQPFVAGTVEFSLGDLGALAGTAAAEGVTINVGAADIPPSLIISRAANPNFTLTTALRLAAGGIVFGFVDAAIRDAGTVVSHIIQNVETGVFSAPVAGGGIFPGAPPAGAILPSSWYFDTTAAIPTPANGTYRVLTTVRNTGPLLSNDLGAFHDWHFMVTD